MSLTAAQSDAYRRGGHVTVAGVFARTEIDRALVDDPAFAAPIP